MKQSFGKTLMSCFLAVTLMASVIAGAISVSVLHAKADDPASYGVGYFADLAAEARESCPAIRLVYFDALCAYASENFDTSLVVIMHDLNTTNWYFAVYTFDPNNTADRWAFTDRNYSVFRARNSSNNFYFYCQYCVGWNANNSYSVSNPPKYIENANGSSVTYGTQGYYVPSPTNTGVSGRVCYANQNILAWSGTGSVFNEYWTPNLLNGNAPPEYEEFELVKFTLGERSYLTVSNQWLLVSDIWAEHLYWKLFNDQGDLLDLTFHDLIEFPDGKSYINYEFTDEGDNSVYAYDITNLDWAIIESSEMYDIPPTSTAVDVYAIAVNTPFNLQAQDSVSDSYAQAWDTFYTYYNTYNTTHVIPEQLSDWLFNTDGAKLFPVTVQVPNAIWLDLYHSSDAPDNHVWRWGGLLAEEHGFQYSLYDTVIIGPSNAGYIIRYFYSDTLDPMYQNIEYMALENVLDSFDVVIIVPDSDGYLDPVSMGSGYTGETGVVYVSDSAELVGNNWTGFAIVTEKAIAKQQLWNFNEGISKLYQLEVDYIESEDKWKDSFLLWSASMFDMINSVDGRLNSILNSLTSLSTLIDQIRTTLNDIAADPDPDEVKPWYLSLWLFMKQFEPSNAQISEGLGYLVENIDDIPLLPALTPVPALPTPGGG